MYNIGLRGGNIIWFACGRQRAYLQNKITDLGKIDLLIHFVASKPSNIGITPVYLF